MQNTPAPILDRLLRRTVLVLHPSLGSCWLWTGSRTEDGYGRLIVGGRRQRKQVLTHRAAWLELCGPIPLGKVLDHRCERRACWNPGHVTLETIHGNASRSPRYNGTKTHCKQGHPLSGSNLVRVRNGTRWKRGCRICINAAAVAYRRRKGRIH